MGARNQIGRNPKARKKFASKKKFTEKSVTFFQKPEEYGTLFERPEIRKSTFQDGSRSTGVRENHRLNTPIIPDSKNPNKRIGGMSDLAIAVSQQLKPTKQSY